MHEILSVHEARAMDEGCIVSGIPGFQLMENAGRAVAHEIARRFSPGGVVMVLCGSGNNGGDGYVAARYLQEAGFNVHVQSLVALEVLKGDAAVMHEKWNGTVEDFTAALPKPCAFVVDALFGTGASRDMPLPVQNKVQEVHKRNIPIVAVDMPSWVNPNSGECRIADIHACLTVTFQRKKPCHVLFPARSSCGEVVVADIGIADKFIPPTAQTHENTPDLWLEKFPRPGFETHKYKRGHAVVVGGGLNSTGAATLAATAVLRAGAGLVTLLSPRDAFVVYAAKLTAVMVKELEDFDQHLSDTRKNAFLLGPGLGVTDSSRRLVEQTLKAQKITVLDADAISLFAGRPQELAGLIKSPCIITPHEGEFARLHTISGNKLEGAKSLAAQLGAVVVYKGADTVIAAPDGRAAVNCNATPWLATAGSGDVLAGIITGLAAQGMPAFEAAAAGVWMHGECARIIGAGLIAEDLPAALPRVISGVYQILDSITRSVYG